MRIEAKRKFLVSGNGWKASVAKAIHLRDGLVMHAPGTKLRVRREPNRAFLTYKGPRSAGARREFNYEIPCNDADILLSDHCEGVLVERTRHMLHHDGLVWMVDVYEGALEGTVTAEVELDYPHQDISLPGWVGAEVTGNPEYLHATMLNGR
ncbi:CYTH domain-containing protein [Aquisediminimonas sediminicola]|uniref:CYTH domain-containing protein n=1 Tax=Alteraquisediminimonas sediminicola TaxID=2676787 RepID=UPI001C8E1ECD|nr:CYTH domain-containing protein [Aquisediminimonas sediminicola]